MFLPILGPKKKVFFATKTYTIASDMKMEPTYQILSVYDKNCGRLSLYRHTNGQTDKSMKTEGPILMTSPFLASFSLDLEWSNIVFKTESHNSFYTFDI